MNKKHLSRLRNLTDRMRYVANQIEKDDTLPIEEAKLAQELISGARYLDSRVKSIQATAVSVTTPSTFTPISLKDGSDD